MKFTEKEYQELLNNTKKKTIKKPIINTNNILNDKELSSNTISSNELKIEEKTDKKKKQKNKNLGLLNDLINTDDNEIKKQTKVTRKRKIDLGLLKDLISDDKLLEDVEVTPKKLGIDVKGKITDPNKKAIIELNYDNDHITILFKNARLLSVNQIFSILQYRKFAIFSYKKTWQQLVSDALLLTPQEKLPIFDSNCELVLFRQSKKLVDSDAMSVMFKFIIDALKYDKKEPNKKYVLKDDSPDIVKNIKLKQIKDKIDIVGIRIQRVKDSEKDFSLDDFLKKSNYL